MLMGTGVRTKKIAGIKSLDIYALALYVNRGAAQSALGRRFSGRAPAELAKDQELFDTLIKSSTVEKSLMIKITSGLVKRGNFLEALNERMQRPLQRMGETKALELFQTQFDDVQFRKCCISGEECIHIMCLRWIHAL